MHHRKRGEVLHRERESMETLQSIKAEIGTLLFSSQYLQQPVPIEGNLIRRSWFRTYDALPAGGVVRVVQSWDVAAVFGPNNDYSVCTTWHVRNNDGYLAHVYRGRLEYPDLRRKIVSLAMERPNTTVLIEYAGPSMYLLCSPIPRSE